MWTGSYLTIRRYGWTMGRAAGMSMTFLPIAALGLSAILAGAGLI